jgi:hypothetical protein
MHLTNLLIEEVKNCKMSPFMLLSLVFLLAPAACFPRHVININSSVALELSSLAWDPVTGRFVAGSISGPNVYAIPDVGEVKCLVSEPSPNSSGVWVSAVAIDHILHRLIVIFSNNSSTVAAYDMKSYGRIFAVPLPELDGVLSGVAVDMKSGDVFVSSSRRGVVLKVGSGGGKRKVISEFKISDDEGLGGLVHTSNGYIITVQVRSTYIITSQRYTSINESLISLYIIIIIIIIINS